MTIRVSLKLNSRESVIEGICDSFTLGENLLTFQNFKYTQEEHEPVDDIYLVEYSEIEDCSINYVNDEGEFDE